MASSAIRSLGDEVKTRLHVYAAEPEPARKVGNSKGLTSKIS